MNGVRCEDCGKEVMFSEQLSYRVTDGKNVCVDCSHKKAPCEKCGIRDNVTLVEIGYNYFLLCEQCRGTVSHVVAEWLYGDK